MTMIAAANLIELWDLADELTVNTIRSRSCFFSVRCGFSALSHEIDGDPSIVGLFFPGTECKAGISGPTRQAADMTLP
jgi:hypothetical protein